MVEHMRALTTILPGDVAFLIGDQLMNAVRASEKTKGLGIVLAFLVATYGGTNGAASVITALNIAYEEKEKRSLVSFYLLAVSMTLGALMIALLALAGTAALAFLQHLLPGAASAVVLRENRRLPRADTHRCGGRIGPLSPRSFAREGEMEVDHARDPVRCTGMAAVDLVRSGSMSAQFRNYHASYGSLGTVVALLSVDVFFGLRVYCRRRAQQRDRASDGEGQHDRMT